MKKLLVLLTTLLLVSCAENPQSPPQPKPQVTYTPVIVKKKYSENSVTKDLVFGTGNWHSTDYYIVDTHNKIWKDISKDDYILCDVGDTLWTVNGRYLQLKRD
jgi:hypothetical protein